MDRPTARLIIVRCINPLAEAPPADRILIIRLGALGDVVRTLPALRVLRQHYSQAHVTWLIEPAAAAAIESQPGVDDVFLFPRDVLANRLRRGRFLAALRIAARVSRELRRRRFDLVLDFHAILKSGALALLSGAPVRVSYARPYGREGAWLFANRRAVLKPARANRFERNMALVRFLGIGGECSGAPLQVDPALREEMAQQLGCVRRSVLIHPGTSVATPHKRYSIEAYAEVARSLAKQTGLRCLVACGPAAGERSRAEAIVAAAEGAAEHAPATPTLSHLSALVANAKLFIGSDSGPLHVASLAGTPVVQILGPTDSVENAPYPETSYRVVRDPVACSPCRRGCEAAVCMRLISPQRVVAAALELLAELRGRENPRVDHGSKAPLAPELGSGVQPSAP